MTIDNGQLTIMVPWGELVFNLFPKETPSLSIYLLNLKFSETLPDMRAESRYKTNPAVGE